MKHSVSILSLLAVLTACAPDGGPLATPAGAPSAARAAEANEYIVVLRDHADPRAVAAAAGVAPRRLFAAALKGFAGTLNAGQLTALQRNPLVAYVEPDAPAELFTTQLFPTWGIDRIDETDLPLSNTFSYTATGAGVRAYVLDTGVRKTHAQFGGRADYIANGANGDFVGDGHGNAEDCHGHGTHVAGTIGGSSYGVAKQVLIRAGRVVNCSGGGTASMAIAAMDWVRLNGTKPAVVNLSLGYGNVQSVRDAAANLVSAGYFVAAAAGNGDFAGVPQNACQQSPAGAPSVMTVGSTTSTDNESSFSNYGTCVDILAPGSSITSAWWTSDTANYTDSGTSMATPHVAGVAALYLQSHPTILPWATTLALKSIATSNTITLHSHSLTGGTPNLLLFTNY